MTALLVSAIVWLVGTPVSPLLPLGAVVLAAGFVAGRRIPLRNKRAAILAAAVAASVFDYLAWRVRVINWQVPWLSLPLFVAEVFGAFQILGFHYTLWPRDEVPLCDDEDPTRRPVFIFIPTVDEGVEVVGPTVRGALAARRRYLARYPQGSVNVVVCNDGRVAGAACSDEVEALCRDLRVHCVTRVLGGGAKAGNIEHARQAVGATGDALVVVFDADQVAEPEFLLATVPNFRDVGVGWVQTGQFYRNVENPIARWANDQQAIFYRVLGPGKAAANAAFICGTNVAIRAEALDEIGGFPQTSVTEDFAASILLHRRWRSLFVPGVLARGIGPVELQSYFRQQRRWARGTSGVLRQHWRDIFVPTRRGGLHPEQRAHYALASTHYFSGLRDLVYVGVPIVFLVTGLAAVRGADLSQFLAYFVPYWVLTQVAFWYVSRGSTTWRGMVIGFGSFPVLAAAALSGLVNGGGSFLVTAKRRVGGGALRHVMFHIALLGACVAAIATAAVRGGGVTTLISAVWAAYTGLLLAMFIGLAVADRVFVSGWTFAWRPRITLRPLRSRLTFAAVGLTVVLVVVLLPSALGVDHTHAAVGVRVARHVGLDLTTDLVGRGTAEIEAHLGYHVGLVGRTQEISDHFDRSWAQAISARGATPWLTLLFTARGRPNYEASLPSVVNGVHDGELRSWAQEIASWGRPVDLTVLPDVDRNWVVTSAVANSGIPQDAARAWTHVRSVFRSAGAENVKWIWAPADPSSDRAYVPPAGSYDGVLLSLVEYPGTTWPDPRVAITRVRARHPVIPLLIETTVAGPEQQREAWLRSLGAAVGERGDVAALIYHEGGPAPVATPVQRSAWSIGPDPQLTAAFAWAAERVRPVGGTAVGARPPSGQATSVAGGSR